MKSSYSLLYFWIFAYVSYQATFFSLYCLSLGFSRSELALIMSAGSLAVIVAPPVVQRIAYSWISPGRLLSISGILSVIFFVPTMFLSDVVNLLLVWFFAMCANKAFHSIGEAQAIRESVGGAFNFEKIRLWGSVGFLFGSLVLGAGLDAFGERSLSYIGLFFVVCIALSGLGIYRREADLRTGNVKEERCESTNALTRGYILPLCLLFLANFLNWVSHQVFYVYFAVYLRELGYTGVFVSSCWAACIIAEVVFFMCFSFFRSRLSLKSILLISLIASALRWEMLALSSNALLLLFAQVFHALTFGGVYISCVNLVYLLLPDHLRDRGQGWLVSTGAGLGALSGRFLLAGLIGEYSIPTLFHCSALVALSAVPVVILLKIPHKGLKGVQQHPDRV